MGKQSPGQAYSGLSQHVDFTALPEPGDRFLLETVVGEGTYGEVHAARDLHRNGQYVAIKILEDITDNIEEIEEEFLVLRDLCRHPNITQFHGMFFKPGKSRDHDQLWFVMELCDGGSVTDLVQWLAKGGSTLTEMQIAYILKETIKALVHLHQNHCMHRDVKGHNILLTGEGNVKVVDFGVSSHLAATLGRRNTSVGTPYWMAPEVIACEQQYDYSYDVRCDVWSLGITAIELADSEPPLADMHPMRALFQIPRNPPPSLKRPADWSAAFNDFISRCLIKDFEKRPFMSQLLDHALLRNVPSRIDTIRGSIRSLLVARRQTGGGGTGTVRRPHPTTKQGRLKTGRKSKLAPMFVDDLASLERLTEEVIVTQLQQRYRADQIYTYIGDILIAVNPFSDVNIYGEKEQRLYRSLRKADGPPHIYGVADAAYHAMLHQRQHQCVVISGESGAGKTESANHLLRQLVSLGQAGGRGIEQRILAANPVMEAFGNAATGINSNSSRFGKFLEVTFGTGGRVSGARVSVYLLEQSRVVRQASGERNFHIFYYLYDTLQAEGRLREFRLDPQGRNAHRYISNNVSNNRAASRNVQTMAVIRQSLTMLGFGADQFHCLCRLLAAVIHLGDISFSSTDDSHNNTEKVAVSNKEKLNDVAHLLGLDREELEEVLTLNSVVTRGESILRNNSHEEAVTTRDAMAKALYGRLFDWIVNQ
ncbi:myosin-IIIa-like, partial [Amphibalanus amphitrite]|uniref:myosin-IIIa-like n=1 Tax=Amphibalanus amphitrite TaxID=1232801 RepID=UPI001C901758